MCTGEQILGGSALTNGGKLFKMTVLEAQTELEGILPDLGFSPKVFFDLIFVKKYFQNFEKFNFENRGT